MRLSVQPKLPNGKPIPGGLPLWLLDTNTLKDDLWARIEAGCFYLHNLTDDLFASQVTAEIKERDRRGKEIWVLQRGQANHLLDCTVYAAAIADGQWLGRIMGLSRPKENPDVQPQSKGSIINPFTGLPSGDWLGR